MRFEGARSCIQLYTFLQNLSHLKNPRDIDIQDSTGWKVHWPWHDVPCKDNISVDDKFDLVLLWNDWHIDGLPFWHYVTCQKHYLAIAWYMVPVAVIQGTNLEKHSPPFIYIDSMELMSIRMMIYENKMTGKQNLCDYLEPYSTK